MRRNGHAPYAVNIYSLPVEKTVDRFFDFPVKILGFALAKKSPTLINRGSPYISIRSREATELLRKSPCGPR
jgi:hypothetical protein